MHTFTSLRPNTLVLRGSTLDIDYCVYSTMARGSMRRWALPVGRYTSLLYSPIHRLRGQWLRLRGGAVLLQQLGEMFQFQHGLRILGPGRPIVNKDWQPEKLRGTSLTSMQILARILTV